MTEVLTKIKQSTISNNGFLNNTITLSTLATSKTQVPVDNKDDKKDVAIVDEEEVELPEYEKVKVVGRGTHLISVLCATYLIITSKCRFIWCCNFIHQKI